MESFLLFDEIRCYPCYHNGNYLIGCIEDDGRFIFCKDCSDKIYCPKYKKINHH